MRLTADTNVLLRAIVGDDEAQGALATQALEEAEAVAISLQTLCELAWVLARRYRVPRARIADTIRRLAETRNVTLNRPAVDWGLRMLEAGGDFADGIIAFDGAALGADTFVSFDRKAVSLLLKQGRSARLLA